jgi:hypothetical protein
MISIIQAIECARQAVSKDRILVVAGQTIEVTDIMAAFHSSTFGRSEDYWVVAFGLNQSMPIKANCVKLYVNSIGEVALKPPRISVS